MSLELKNICVNIEDKQILNDISLLAEDGEFISLLGPSGCGKSTLLKTIAGLLEEERGHVFINGQSVNKAPVNKRGAVIVFQDLRLFPNMNVAENVAFPLKMQGMGKAARLVQAEQMLKKVQLEGFGKRRIAQMSGGQLQRVALARALAARPKLLLLDEPFSSLDENLRQEMRELVLKLHSEFGMTTILVTHDQNEALSMSNRIALMFCGRIIQYDTPQNVFDHPFDRRTADYFGQANYIPGIVESGIFKSRLISFETNAADGLYEAMLRPSSFILNPSGHDFIVKEVRYAGETCEIRVRGEEVNLTLSIPSGNAPEQGTHTGIMVEAQRPVLFRQE